MFNRILTLCTGNICRSPLAEYLLRQQLEQRGKPAQVSSAGIGALVGHEADEDTQSVALKHGIDLSAHQARQLSVEILRQSDLILAMEKHHMEYAARLDPASRGKLFLLGHWNHAEVPDPYRLGREQHELAYQIINDAAGHWLNKL